MEPPVIAAVIGVVLGGAGTLLVTFLRDYFGMRQQMGDISAYLFGPDVNNGDGGLDEEVEGLESQLDSLGYKVDNLDGRMEKLEDSVDHVEDLVNIVIKSIDDVDFEDHDFQQND